MGKINELEIPNTEPIYTLSIVSTLSETPAHSIRQYIDKGLIIPFTTKTKRHLFSKTDIFRLKCIRNYLSNEGLNVAGIKALYSAIPCWLIKPCTPKDRESCGAYIKSSQPCWQASDKSGSCKNLDCRVCAIYRLPETCQDLKSVFKQYL